MYTISKEFHFSAAHKLTDLPEDHPCTRLHGHNYVVKVELGNAVLNKVGFVKDYREMSVIKDWIDEHLDNRYLNEVFHFNPTAENMAKHLYHVFKVFMWQVSAVEVCETPKTIARYEP